MSHDTKDVLESFQDFVEGEEDLDVLEGRLEGTSLEEVQELYDRYSDDLAEQNPARAVLLESLFHQEELEDQDPRRRPAPPGARDPDL